MHGCYVVIQKNEARDAEPLCIMRCISYVYRNDIVTNEGGEVIVIELNHLCKSFIVRVAYLNDSTGPTTTQRVKTWFIKRPVEPTDAVGSGGGGDAAAHVTVKVENAVLDGGVTEEVM